MFSRIQISKLIKQLCVVGITGLLCVFATFADEVKLVENGRGQAVILISPVASATEEYAAQELQEYIRRMSHGELPIQRGESVPEGKDKVVIGCPSSHSEIKRLAPELGLTNNPEESEKLVIKTIGNTLYLVGNTPAGALYAVYYYLDEILGVRWYWPGKDGEFVPSKPTILAIDLNISQVPDFVFRGYRGFYDEDTLIWLARNRMNYGPGHYIKGLNDLRRKLGMKVIYGGHSFGHIYPPGIKSIEEYFEKYPEHFSLVAGKRVLKQHCYSNPEVQKVFIKWIINFWDEHPDVDTMRLCPLDSPHFCQCKKCKAFGKDVSTQLHKFINIILEEVDKVYPGKHYQVYAYSTYKNPPVVKPHKGITIEYCMYDRCYRHTLFDKNCPVNAKAIKKLEEWLKLGYPMYMYGYHYDVFGGERNYFIPNAFTIADELKYLKKIGFKGFATEVRPPRPNSELWPDGDLWMCNRFSLYLGAKLMWNTNLDEDKLLAEYMRRIYSPGAARYMVKYYKLMEKAWASGGHVSYYSNSPSSVVNDFLTPEVIDEASKLFGQAERAIQKIKQGETRIGIKKRFNIERKMFTAWVKLARKQAAWMDIAKGKKPWSADAFYTPKPPDIDGKPDDSCWEKSPKIKNFVDGKNKPVTSENDTEVSLCWDEKAMYLLIICHESDMAKIVAQRKEHDDNQWADDCIELFVDPQMTRTDYYHLAINSLNAHYDALASIGMNFDKGWNGRWNTAVSKGKDRWILEVELPFETFGGKAEEDSQWLLGINRSVAGRRTNSSWTDGSYHNPNSFRVITLRKKGL